MAFSSLPIGPSQNITSFTSSLFNFSWCVHQPLGKGKISCKYIGRRNLFLRFKHAFLLGNIEIQFRLNHSLVFLVFIIHFKISFQISFQNENYCSISQLRSIQICNVSCTISSCTFFLFEILACIDFQYFCFL